MTHAGITVRVVSVVADRARTALRLAASIATPGTLVRALGTQLPRERLTLVDDHGRAVEELPPPAPRFQNVVSPSRAVDVLFPPLAADAREVTLVVPYISIEEPAEPAHVRAPVAGVRVGDHIMLPSDYMLGPYPFRVVDAEVVEQFGRVRLLLRLDFGVWHYGRILAGPGGVSSAEADVRELHIEPRAGVGQWAELSVPLPATPQDTITFTFSRAVLVVEGPWQLPFTIP